MNRLLLIALPALLAACTKPGTDQPAPPAATPDAATPAAATEAAAPGVDAATPAVNPTQASQPVFEKVPVIRATSLLSRQRWALASATDAGGKRIDALLVRADKPLELDFQRSGNVAVANACNKMSGPYRMAGQTVKIGPYAATKMACADPKLAALDAEVGKRLQGDFGLRMAGGATMHIELTSASGDVLVFDGSDTAETRYGGPGERIFLEIAADTKPCNHPLMRDKQCLQAREISFDDKGLKVGTPGAYTLFHEQIQGYYHEPGVRNVLRINRYTRTNPPADASKYAYVLDMVVETDGSAKQAADKAK